MEDNKNENPYKDYNASKTRFKLQRWHSWFCLTYFSMYSIVSFIRILQSNDEEWISNTMLLYAICIPLFIILCFAHSNIIITLYSTRLKPLLIMSFPKQFADENWNLVYSKFYYPTAIIFTWITMIGSVLAPIYFAVYYAKWWAWLIYIVVVLINLILLLFTAANLYDLHKVATAVYNKYEGEKK